MINWFRGKDGIDLFFSVLITVLILICACLAFLVLTK